MLPSDYGIPATSPEAYVAIAVEALINKVGKETLHANGTPSKEYLGMLGLYAIRDSTLVFGEGQPLYSLAKLSYEHFDPNKMSDDLIRCLTDLINPTEP